MSKSTYANTTNSNTIVNMEISTEERRKQQRREAQARYRRKNASIINAKKREKRNEQIDQYRIEGAKRMQSHRRRKQVQVQSLAPPQSSSAEECLPQLPTEVVNRIMEFGDEPDIKESEKSNRMLFIQGHTERDSQLLSVQRKN